MMPLHTSRHLGAKLGLAGATLAALCVAQGCGGDATVASRNGKEDPLASGGSAGKGASSGGDTGSGASASTGGSNATGSGATGGSGVIVFGGSGQAGQAGEGGAAPGCGATALHSSRPIVNMLLVVDKSSSMSITDEFPDGRWKTLGDALGVALEQSESRISFGLEFFPFADDPTATPDTCQTPTGMDVLVPVGAGTDTVPVIEKAFTTYAPAGGTPTADALAHALEYFEHGDGKNLPGTTYVLLATDGGPNCNADLTCDASTCTLNLEDPTATMKCNNGSCCDVNLDPAGPTNCLDQDRTVAQVGALAKAGVKTFVVGIPGSQFFAHTLDAIAQAGLEENPSGSPSYYAVTSSDGPQGLTDVLTRITSGLITSCRLQLTSTPDDPNYEKLLNVEIDGADVPQQGADGWSVDTTTSPPTIVLAGKTCDYMEQHGAERVQITYGCPTVMVK
jgi:hypothetical protein